MNVDNILQVENHSSHSAIKLSGFIDAAIVESIRPTATQKLVEASNNIVLDLEDVEFLDSHGVGFLVSILKRVHANEGKLVISGAHDQPASVLRMVGFNNNLVTYCDNYEQASSLLN